MMEEAVVIWRGFVRELVPTPLQALASVFLAFCILAALQSQQILSALGISHGAVESTRTEFAGRFSVILQASLTSNIALVTFWASIGLVAYLVCWGAYNALIAARNEVTIETQYTNRGHWRGVWETLSLKAVAALALVFYITTLKYGFSLWGALTVSTLAHPSLTAALIAISAIFGFATQLYIGLFLIQLTISPWYHSEAFTD